MIWYSADIIDQTNDPIQTDKIPQKEYGRTSK